MWSCTKIVANLFWKLCPMRPKWSYLPMLSPVPLKFLFYYSQGFITTFVLSNIFLTKIQKPNKLSTTIHETLFLQQVRKAETNWNSNWHAKFHLFVPFYNKLHCKVLDREILFLCVFVCLCMHNIKHRPMILINILNTCIWPSMTCSEDK